MAKGHWVAFRRRGSAYRRSRTCRSTRHVSSVRATENRMRLPLVASIARRLLRSMYFMAGQTASHMYTSFAPTKSAQRSARARSQDSRAMTMQSHSRSPDGGCSKISSKPCYSNLFAAMCCIALRCAAMRCDATRSTLGVVPRHRNASLQSPTLQQQNLHKRDGLA